MLSGSSTRHGSQMQAGNCENVGVHASRALISCADVIFSFIGALIGAVGIGVWAAIFQVCSAQNAVLTRSIGKACGLGRAGGRFVCCPRERHKIGLSLVWLREIVNSVRL